MSINDEAHGWQWARGDGRWIDDPPVREDAMQRWGDLLIVALMIVCVIVTVALWIFIIANRQWLTGNVVWQ